MPSADTEQSPEAVAALDTLTAAQGGAEGTHEDGALATGARLGRYVVLGRLGAGGMGVVYAAWDPELDRRVAVKLLHRRVGGTDGPARMLREAQALARLQHENVLAVHDVGQVGDRVFVATELVPGGTLAAWLAGRPPWREVLRAFAQAGRGLQAAHAAGLVHRDFKPENVLLGPESRVRVVDFGLARTDTSDERTATGSSSGSLLGSPLTQEGAIVGTPAYMAPEQHAGRAVGPPADQFSFAVALWEGLYGERPFAGTTVQSVRAEVLAGRVQPAPRGPVPRRLQAVLARALEVEPERRYPSMEALLAALARDPARAWRRRLAMLGGAFAIGLATLGALAVRAERAQRCPAAAARRAQEAWPVARRRGIEQAFAATGAPRAEATAARVASRLDAWIERWRESSERTCERSHREGDATALLGERCLERRRAAFSALVSRLLAADADVVRGAAEAAGALEDVAGCEDALSLSVEPDAPEASMRDRAAALSSRLDAARVEIDLGRLRDATASLGPLCADAHALGYAPLVAEAEYLRGYALELQTQGGEAGEALARAAVAGLEGGHLRIAARALAGRAFVVGLMQNDRARADELAAEAEALARRAHDGQARIILELARGGTLHVAGRMREALVPFGRALAEAEKLEGSAPPLLVHTLQWIGNAELRLGELDRAQATHARALSLRESTLGPDHPDLARSLMALGAIDLERGQPAAARAAFERAVRIAAQLGADDPTASYARAYLGRACVRAGDLEAAARELAAARASIERALGPEHTSLAMALLGQGELALARGDPRAAAAPLERALALRASRGDVIERADITLALATALARDSPARARVLADEAIRAFEQDGSRSAARLAKARASCTALFAPSWSSRPAAATSTRGGRQPRLVESNR